MDSHVGLQRPGTRWASEHAREDSMGGRKWRGLLIGLSLYVLGSVLATPSNAAKIPLFWEEGEKIVKIADFPDTAQYRSSDGHNFDAGLIFKHFSLFSVPLWVWDVRWCGYISDTLYMEFDTVELSTYARAAGVTLPPAPPVPFWDEWGGKLTVIGLLAVVLGWGWYAVRREEKAEADQT